MQLLKQIRITRIENRPSDAWYDLGLRQMRNGQVGFYRVRDFLTGGWLFKTCRDSELGKFLVKAVKCPPGTRFAQLEGNTMVFQPSIIDDMLYDIISLTQADENDRVSRKTASSEEDTPAIIRENYKIVSYKDATGKAAPGKHIATLCKRQDEKAMIMLFLLERAWTLSDMTPEEKLKVLKVQVQKIRKPAKEIDTGQKWKCPICGDEFRLKHIEKEKTARHALKKQRRFFPKAESVMQLEFALR